MSDAISRLNVALAGRYRVERQLGEGGMATVYLADDLRHGRKVALKVLKPELAVVVGAERFLAEIRTTASLQHPHILPLFDSGEADNLLFYVMPRVEGESLRERLDRERQLPVDEAIRIATNVAEALDYAHARGVIHRDIKPANILMQAGKPVISDFGIALAVSAAGGGRLTETGLSLGTPHYMSPEQATGDTSVGPASDIWALGCVLYETLVGEPPYTGSTPQAVLGRIIAGEPPSACAERKLVPANVDAAIRKALEKVPADRFTTAARFAEALANPAFSSRRGSAVAGTTSRPSATERYAWLFLTVAAFAAAWFGWRRVPEPPAVERLEFVLPEDQALAVLEGLAHPFAISPDGTRLAYVAGTGGGTPQLFLRNLDDYAVTPLDGTADARQPFFSPDGTWIGYFAGGMLMRVSVNGGAPIPIAAAGEQTGGADWGPDGRILYSARDSLYLVAAEGSTPALVALRSDSLATRPAWPSILPGGTHALVTACPEGPGCDVLSGIFALDLATHEATYVTGGRQAVYVPTGHMVFHARQEGNVLSMPFDLDRLSVTGPEIPVLEGVFRGPGGGAAEFAVARAAGTLLFVRGGTNRSLVLVDRSGRVTDVPAQPRGYRFPRVAPDGRYVAVTVDPRPSDLWIIDLQRGTGERQETPGHDGWGMWSPDGDRIAFNTGIRETQLAWREYPFVSPPTRLALRQGQSRIQSFYTRGWALDERLIGNGELGDAETGQDILSVAIADGSVTALLATRAREVDPVLSRDGRWIAFVSDVSGMAEIYVHGYPTLGAQHTISVGGGVDPNWSWDGTELFYRRGNSIMAVRVQTGEAFEVLGEPELVFSGLFDFTQEANWGVLPDGRFLMIRGDPTTTTRIQVVSNWFQELRESSAR